LDLLSKVRRQPVLGKLVNEREEVVSCLFGYIRNIPAQGLEHLINRMPPVKELPHVDAAGVQTETTTGVRVEENGPIVKLLPEQDVWVGYGFFTVLHESSFLPHRHRHALAVHAQRGGAICVPGTRIAARILREWPSRQTLPGSRSFIVVLSMPHLFR
jgi:hypothetical protein